MSLPFFPDRQQGSGSSGSVPGSLGEMGHGEDAPDGESETAELETPGGEKQPEETDKEPTTDGDSR